MPRTNEYGQPIGEAVEWTERPVPEHKTFKGKYCTLVKPSVEHSQDLFVAHKNSPGDWTYMFVGPFETAEGMEKLMADKASSNDPLHFTVVDNSTGKPVGTLSYLRIDPKMGSIEVGHVTFSDKMKNTFMSTEAHFLLMKEAFDHLGYRRYEWKCDSLNAPSRKAAQRLGFQFEGVFRKNVVYRGRSRDTAWFSITDDEWPALKMAFEAYLSEANNDNGKQIKSLKDFQDI